MKKMKIGVLGCANIADRMMLPAIKESGVFELAAVSSRSAEKAKAFAAKFGGFYRSGGNLWDEMDRFGFRLGGAAAYGVFTPCEFG